MPFANSNAQNGQDRFANHNNRRRSTTQAGYSSSDSAESNYSATGGGQRQRTTTYEPGTGAHYMQQAGFSNRDQYGNPRRQSTVFPAITTPPQFIPAPRQPHQQPVQPNGRDRNGVGAARYSLSQPQQQQQHTQHRISFSEGPNYKKIYMIALIAVSILLLSFIVLIVVLFVTNVISYNGFPSSAASTPSPTPVIVPTTPGPPPADQPPRLVTRTFECEFFILDQANQAYDNSNSFEQFQAQSIVQNALMSTLEHSSVRDLNPSITLTRLENSASDLHVVFQLGIVVLEQNTAFREQSIRNLLVSEAGLLEAYMNRVKIDRARIFVRSQS